MYPAFLISLPFKLLMRDIMWRQETIQSIQILYSSRQYNTFMRQDITTIQTKYKETSYNIPFLSACFFFSFYLCLLSNNPILSFNIPFYSSSTLYHISYRFALQSAHVWHYVSTLNDTIYPNTVSIKTKQHNMIHYEKICNNHPNKMWSNFKKKKVTFLNPCAL